MQLGKQPIKQGSPVMPSLDSRF